MNTSVIPGGSRLDELAAWSWLSDTSDSATFHALELLQEYESPLKVAEASSAQLTSVTGAKFVARLNQSRSRYEGDDFSKRVHDLMATGVRVVTIRDKSYPVQLRGIDNPPLLLFWKGRLRSLTRPIAIVGTRIASDSGMSAARLLSEELSRAGHCIVSGLARGIDTMAHYGALDGEGETVAVLPGPLDFVYPPENALLADDIVEKGALVAENSPVVSLRDPQPQKFRWVKRNRIISGLAEAVVVIEVTKSGGSMHQVRYAITQGRPVFVMKPGPDSRRQLCDGFRSAIAAGAKSFESHGALLSLLRSRTRVNQSFLNSAGPCRSSHEFG